MRDDNMDHEERIKRKAEVFFEEKLIAHISKFNGDFFNGRFFEIRENHLIMHDRVVGLVKVFFCDIKILEEYKEV